MDGWAADQQGGRNDGAFPGDDESGGRSRTYHWDGWADIFCIRRRCSAKVKQQGAVQRLGLGSRLQQGTVLQNSLKTIKTQIQLIMKRTDIKINSSASVFPRQ